MAQPRYTTLMANTVQRVPNVVASRARANWVPCHWLMIHCNRGRNAARGSKSCRWSPHLATASVAPRAPLLPHGLLLASQPRGEERGYRRQGRGAREPQAHTPQANTVAWGLLNAGRWVLIIVVHSMMRLWLDMIALLGWLRFMGILRMAHRGRSCHGLSAPSRKNLPRKGCTPRSLSYLWAALLPLCDEERRCSIASTPIDNRVDQSHSPATLTRQGRKAPVENVFLHQMLVVSGSMRSPLRIGN